MTINEKIKARAEELGITHTELARRTGLSRPYISQIINGDRGGDRLSHTSVVRLAEALGVDLSFFEGDERTHDDGA